MISFLTPEIEEELRVQEANPFNVIRAREVLESALTVQLRKLADGLVAYLALRGQDNESVWIQHALANWDLAPPLENEKLAGLSKEFAADVAAGRVKPISPAKLEEVEVRILGGCVRLWDDNRINRQLRGLGSSYRLVLVGSNRLIVNQVRKILGRLDVFPVDARFIFGRIGSLSSWLLGPVFNFEKEVAVSPYVSLEGAGFNYENKVVVRQPVMRLLLGNVAALQALSAITHEMIHVAGYRAQHIGSYAEAAWEEDTISDICRFTEVPRRLEELEREFFLNFSGLITNDVNKTLGYERFPQVPRTLHNLVEMLIRRGVLLDSEGSLKCLLYSEGRRWWS